MTEQIIELQQQLIVGRRWRGWNCYDPQAKRELIAASLLPGVSMAKLALTHDINANLLRTSVSKHQRQLSAGGSFLPSAATPAPFIPVVAVSAQRSPIAPVELAAWRPNGVRLGWPALSTSSWRLGSTGNIRKNW